MPVKAEIVDVASLWQTVVVALLAALSVVVFFSFSVLGGVRFEESRRDGRSLLAAAWGVVFCIGLAGSGAAIVLGLIVMVNK